MSRDGYLPPGVEYGDIPGNVDDDPETPPSMYDRGFGTGHWGDLRPTQVQLDDEVHNVLLELTNVTAILGAFEPVPMTMCGIRLDDDGEPYNRGVTTCERCAILSAWRVVSTRKIRT